MRILLSILKRGIRWLMRSFRHLERPVKLALVIFITVFAVAIGEWVFSFNAFDGLRSLIAKSEIFGPILFPETNSGHPIEWKDRLQSSLLIIGLPVAYCLWHWRDRNVRDQIENARKDINLKEFQEVQLRAAGALGSDLGDDAREQLQIAALHQLRGFLRGD